MLDSTVVRVTYVITHRTTLKYSTQYICSHLYQRESSALYKARHDLIHNCYMKKIKIKIKNLTKLNNHITNLSKLKKAKQKVLLHLRYRKGGESFISGLCSAFKVSSCPSLFFFLFTANTMIFYLLFSFSFFSCLNAACCFCSCMLS